MIHRLDLLRNVDAERHVRGREPRPLGYNRTVFANGFFHNIARLVNGLINCFLAVISILTLILEPAPIYDVFNARIPRTRQGGVRA